MLSNRKEFRSYIRKTSKELDKICRCSRCKCMLLAAAEAKLLGQNEFICLEFGVATGGSLKDMCRASVFIEKELGVKCLIYGFDREKGLPEPKGYKDHQEIWESGRFAVDYNQVRKEVNCEIILGDIKDTIIEFAESKLSKNTPLGFVSIDVDYYSSTVDALKVLSYNAENYMTFVPMYFDDVSDLPTYNDWCGEKLAIAEFNEENKYRKIHHYGGNYCQKIYNLQVLDHPVRNGERKCPSFDWLRYSLVGI